MSAGGNDSNSLRMRLKLLEDLEASLVLADSLELSMAAIHIQSAIETLRALKLSASYPAKPSTQPG
jgi:hypothetical protein